MNSVRPSSNTGSVNSSTVKKYKILNYWIIFNGVVMMIVFLIQFIGGNWLRDSILPPTFYNIMPPEIKEKYSLSRLTFNIFVLFIPILVTLFIFGLLIWFSLYKRYTIMGNILVYASILPILALYIWRFALTQIEYTKSKPGNAPQKLLIFYFSYLFEM